VVQERKEFLWLGGRLNFKHEGTLPDDVACGKQLRYCWDHFPTGSYVAVKSEASNDVRYKRVKGALPYKHNSPEGIASCTRHYAKGHGSNSGLMRLGVRERMKEGAVAALESTSDLSKAQQAFIKEQLEKTEQLEEELTQLRLKFDKVTKELELERRRAKKEDLPFLSSFSPDAKELKIPGASQFYTGLPSADTASILVETVIESHGGSLEPTTRHQGGGAAKRLGDAAILMLTMAMLRLNISMSLAKILLGNVVSVFTVGRIFRFGLRVLLNFFQKNSKVPSAAEVRKKIPRRFRRLLGRKVGRRVRFIIDCTEIQIERPTSPKFAQETWSEYKQRYTVKFLVAVTPDGRIVFVSDAYGGRCSDEYITEHCGFLDLLEPGDVVLSDKGFTGSHLFLNRQCLLIRPLNLREGGYDVGEVEFNRRLASCRIHVERAMRRIKAFSWLSGPIKINQLKNISLAFKVACHLGNLNAGLTFKAEVSTVLDDDYDGEILDDEESSTDDAASPSNDELSASCSDDENDQTA
jgi:hypothetical protein